MRLEIGKHFLQTRPHGRALGELISEPGLEAHCLVNGEFVSEWRNYRPEDSDRVVLYPKSGGPLLIPAVSIFLSIGMQLASRFLFKPSKPKSPNNQRREGQRFGVAGLDNTIEPGTPIPTHYGATRSFPHVIGSKTEVSDDGRHMTFSVLGLVGYTGGNEYLSIGGVQINDSDIKNFPGTTFEVRLGGNNQTIIKDFQNVEQVFHDGREIPHEVEIQSVQILNKPTAGTYTLTVPGFGTTAAIAYNADGPAVEAALQAISGLGGVTVSTEGTAPNYTHSVEFGGTAGNIGTMTFTKNFTPTRATLRIRTILQGQNSSASPIVYSTRNQVDEVTIIFSAPGIFNNNLGAASFNIKVERKLSSAGPGAWVEVTDQADAKNNSPIKWKDKSTSMLFRSMKIVLPSKDFWDFRFRLKKSTSTSGRPSVFNVVESQYTQLNYGGDALLAIRGIGSHQITSLSGMRWSCLVHGKKVDVWNGSTFSKIWTNKRMWILRDILTDPRVGMGARIPASLFDDDAALIEQNYLDQQVQGFSGNEPRDQCDWFPAEGRKPAWDYISTDILAEVGGFMIPSGGKLKPFIDKPRSPNLLWAYPGNIADDSQGGPVKTILGYSQKSINTMLVSYFDESRHHITRVRKILLGQVLDEKDDAIQYDTVRRLSQVIREGAKELRRRQIKDRRTWKANLDAQVSEPGDLDYLSDDKVKNIRGYSGALPAGSTLNAVELPRLVTLDPGKTYEVIVKHIDKNTVEKRVIATAPGEWGRLDVAAPFAVAPAEGDIWALGEQSVSVLEMVIETVAMEEDGFRISAYKYDPAVYSPPPLVPEGPIVIMPGSALPPIPLWNVTVTQQNFLNLDGSFSVTLIFDVTPGLARVAGTAQAGGAGFLRVEAGSPPVNDYFNGAQLRIIAGSANGAQKIVADYDGTSRDLTPDTTFSPAPDATSQYEIFWEYFGLYDGFVLEFSTDGASWSLVERVKGTHFEIGGREQGVTEQYRLRPFSTLGLEQLQAQWVLIIDVTGDLQAPAPPNSVAITSHLKTVSVEIIQAIPNEPDFAGYTIELWLTAISSGTLLKTLQVAATFIPSPSPSTITTRYSIAMPEQAYGDVIFARVRARDHSGNESANVDSPAGTTLTQVGGPDVSPNLLTGAVNFSDDSDVQVTASGGWLLGDVTIDTNGGLILLDGKIVWADDDSNSATLFLSLRIGALESGTLIDRTVADPKTGGSMVALCQSVQGPAAGTHTYSLWARAGGIAYARYRRLRAVEIPPAP